MAEELGERTEKPTARRRGDARRKGQVPKSQDLAGAIMLLGGTLFILLAGAWLQDGFILSMRTMLDFGHTPGGLTDASIGPAFRLAMMQAAMMLWPVLLVSFLVAYLVQLGQVGWLFTLKPIHPKFNRLNPISGVRKILGKRGLIKTLTGTLKLIVMVAAAWAVAAANLNRLAALPRLESAAAMRLVVEMGIELALILIVLLLLIAVIDLIYERWQHTKDLMMTKQEIKDERRAMEGDPQIKGRRFRMYQQIVMQQVAAAIPKADVVVNNPTHFSVAIRYDPQAMAAPKVVAKGADLVALRIRHLAAMHDVPMVSRPPLARALYWGTRVGDEVAPEHYEAIAEILAYVYRIDQRPGRTTPEAAAPRRPEPATA